MSGGGGGRGGKNKILKYDGGPFTADANALVRQIKNMKAISLWQPWASAMALGLKQNETRSWPTAYRGDLVICSTKRPLDHDGLAVARENGIPLGGLVFGFALCVVELYECSLTATLKWHNQISEQETALGDYTPGRFAWLTRNCRRLETPVPVIGRQGFWILPPETIELVRGNLSNARLEPPPINSKPI